MSDEQQRGAERIPLEKPIDVTLNDVEGRIVEISLIGCKVEHGGRVNMGSTVTMDFLWQGKKIRLKAKVTRTEMRPIAGKPGYFSALQLAASLEESPIPLRRVVAGLLGQPFDEPDEPEPEPVKERAPDPPAPRPRPKQTPPPAANRAPLNQPRASRDPSNQPGANRSPSNQAPRPPRPSIPLSKSSPPPISKQAPAAPPTRPKPPVAAPEPPPIARQAPTVRPPEPRPKPAAPVTAPAPPRPAPMVVDEEEIPAAVDEEEIEDISAAAEILLDDSEEDAMNAIDELGMAEEIDESPPDYVECILLGGKWIKRHVRDPRQPREGFTMVAPLDAREIDEYCRSYEVADPDTRRMIRVSLELAIARGKK